MNVYEKQPYMKISVYENKQKNEYFLCLSILDKDNE